MENSRLPRTVQMLSPLLNALEFVENRRAFESAREGLILLLPLLRDGDAAHLSEKQRELLRSMLLTTSTTDACDFVHCILRRSDPHEDFQIQIVRVFARLGDEQAIPFIEHLAVSAPGDRVRLAAREALRFLREQQAWTNPRHTLLRAAHGTADASHVLLRPALAAGTTEQAQLLRASPEIRNHTFVAAGARRT